MTKNSNAHSNFMCIFVIFIAVTIITISLLCLFSSNDKMKETLISPEQLVQKELDIITKEPECDSDDPENFLCKKR